MLPLHHALEKLASEAVVAALLAAYPEAAKEKDEVSGRAARPTAPLPLPLRTLPLTLTRMVKAAGQFADQANRSVRQKTHQLIMKQNHCPRPHHHLRMRWKCPWQNLRNI